MWMDVHPECTLKERKGKGEGGRGKGGGANLFKLQGGESEEKNSLTMVRVLNFL